MNSPLPPASLQHYRRVRYVEVDYNTLVFDRPKEGFDLQDVLPSSLEVLCLTRRMVDTEFIAKQMVDHANGPLRSLRRVHLCFDYMASDSWRNRLYERIFEGSQILCTCWENREMSYDLIEEPYMEWLESRMPELVPLYDDHDDHDDEYRNFGWRHVDMNK